MPSLRSRIFCLLLKRYTAKADRDATLPQKRAALEDGARRLPMPRHVDVEQTTVADIPAEWLRPDAAADDCAILYLHGGGHTMGSCASHRALVSRIAIASQTPALLPEFRLAPEHPFPESLEDAVAVYRTLIEQGMSPQKIAIAGDSAGGGLAIALAVMLRDQNVPLPAAIVCLSPWSDLEMTGESLTTRCKVDPYCSVEESKYHAALYIGDHDPREPLISPIYADLQGLPPLFVQVGDKEILLSDADRLTERAREDGVDAEFEVWDGMWHVWQIFARYVPEGRQAIERIGAFIRKQLD